MSDLEDLRRRIDDLDRRLVELLSERLGLASSIAAEKEAAGLSFYDPERERRVLERVADAAAGRFPAGPLQAIFREIISATRAGETDAAVLVHGAWGSLAHYAAFLRFGASARYALTSRAEDLFGRIEDEDGAFAIVSLEGHSLEASLDRFDLFLQAKVWIRGEFHIRPRLGLYAAPGELNAGEPAGAGAGSSSGVEKGSSDSPEAAPLARGPIFGSPAAFLQASRWIERNAHHREFRVAASASDAVRAARESGGSVLGHPLVQALEGFEPLESGLEDVAQAERRFLILGRDEAPASGRDKTSVLAILENRPGELHRVTGILDRHGINLSWIEPKPTHLGRWDHLFVLELDGHREEPRVRAALAELQQIAELLKVLGSYPSDRLAAAEQPSGQPAERAAERAAEQPTGQPAERAAEHPSEQVAKQPPEHRGKRRIAEGR